MNETWQERLLTALYEEHGSALYTFVRRYVASTDVAEDVVQETMLRAWRRVEHVDVEVGNPRSYLFTVARNVLTDRWRAEQSRPRLVSDDAAAAAIATVPSDEDVEAAVERWLVEEALQRLSPEHRGVVHLMYFEGRSVAEAASRLGVPTGTVKSRSYYALRALRAVMEEMGVLR